MASVKNTVIKINPTVETADTQHELEKRRLQRKIELRTQQYGNYRKTFYGTEQEKESLKREHLTALLQQCQDNESRRKAAFRAKVQESQVAKATDKNSKESDSKSFDTKFTYLREFRDQNKLLMEKRSEEARKKKVLENRNEQELLKDDPINWSKTLV